MTASDLRAREASPLHVAHPGAASPRSARRLAALVLPPLFLFYLAGLHGHLIFGPDQAQYVVLGQAIAEGEGYRQVQKVDAPLFTRMPPGLPALFAGVYQAVGVNFWLLNGLVLLLGLFALLLTVKLLTPIAGPRRALAVAALTAVNATFYAHAHETLSEVPYLTLSLVALLAMVRGSPRDHTAVVTAALATAAAFYVRVIGIALIPAGVVAFLFFRGGGRPRIGHAALFVGLATALLLPWILHTLQVQATVPAAERNYSYYDLLLSSRDGGFVESLARRVVRNARSYLILLGDFFLLTMRLMRIQPLPGWVGFAAGAGIALLVMLGVIGRWRRRETAVLLTYLSAYVAVLLAFLPSGQRVFVPLVPILLLFAIWGVERLARWLHVRRTWLAAPATLAYVLPNVAAIMYLLAVGDAESHAGTLTHAARPHVEFLRGPYSDFWRAAEWIDGNSPREAVVATRAEHVFYLASRRKTFFLTKDALADPRTDFAVVDELPMRAPSAENLLLGELRAHAPDGWRQARRFGRVLILQRSAGGSRRVES